jgi:unsaturated rhamnogalacturonyl hydrolase
MNIRLFFLLIISSSFSFAQTFDGRQQWSERIAKSFIAMHPDSIVYADEEKSKRWNYEQGLMLEAFYQMWLHSGDDYYKTYIKKNLDYYICEDGFIKTYKMMEFNIDNIAPGKAVLRAFDIFKEQKYKWASDTLRHQLSLHPRTSEGGFWHKQVYPNQMWLDGLYMGEPFYVLYSSMFHDTAAFDDIANQFLLIAKHTYDKKTGLYFHGWDESKQQQWSNKVTGSSPNIWGRALGWYAVALIDVLEYFPEHHPKRKELITIFQNLMENILKQRDDKLKLWYQVVDKQNAPGNYLEASASCMFTYAFAKGANKNILDKKYFKHAQESFQGILKQFVTVNDSDTIYLNDVVKVSGLGGKPYRDGSFEYYISEPRRTNDFKGYGPFLFAAIELEKGQSKR